MLGKIVGVGQVRGFREFPGRRTICQWQNIGFVANKGLLCQFHFCFKMPNVLSALCSLSLAKVCMYQNLKKNQKSHLLMSVGVL